MLNLATLLNLHFSAVFFFCQDYKTNSEKQKNESSATLSLLQNPQSLSEQHRDAKSRNYKPLKYK